MQPWLIPYENPLARRVGLEFFSTLPRVPGIYYMLGANDSILYVGKAKDLRNRLASYKRARPGQVSRKVIRLIHLVERIRWETCESEEKALLRENELLRAHRPPFNVVNTRPDSYFFIASRADASSITLRLTTLGEPEAQDEELFGVFKGRGSVREAYAAILRLLYASQSQEPRFEIPAVLCGRRTPPRYELPIGPALSGRRWQTLVRRLLSGSSSGLLQILTAQLLANPAIPPFYYRCLQDDLERLREFYLRGPRRNRRLKRRFGLTGRLIAQEEIDDLLVRDRARGPGGS